MKLLIMLTMLVPNVVTVEKEEVEWQPSCSTNSTKSYMDYKAITSRSSKQYKYIQNNMTAHGGLLYDRDGSIGVALGSWWGDIGSKWTVELTNGQVLDIVKIDEKADEHTVNGCYHKSDGSVIEMVVDSDSVPSSWWGGNGLIHWGNFNNYDKFKGKIKRVGKKKITTEEVDVSKWFPTLEIKERPISFGLFSLCALNTVLCVVFNV